MNPLPILTALVLSLGLAQAALPALKVSDNKRFLVTAAGKPFFYLGDTTWELFHRLNRAESVKFLENRAAKKFNVLQSVAIAELEGHTDPNPYGHLPFADLDVTKPAVNDGPQNDYWDHVDFIVADANKRGIYIGFRPTWGRFWHETNNDRKPLFNASNAEAYGEWLGKRYKDAGLIWILGGDRGVDSDSQKEIIRAMAKGLRKGDGGTHLMTVKAWWFNPRDGKATAIATFDNKGERGFAPPDLGEMIDWVLVLDNAATKYPAPGSKSFK